MSRDDYTWSPSDEPETPAIQFTMQLSSEVESGDMRRGLAALRNRIAQELNLAEGKDVATLSLALLKVMESLEKVPDLEAADPLNEIAQRRERRRSEQASRRAAGQ